MLNDVDTIFLRAEMKTVKAQNKPARIAPDDIRPGMKLVVVNSLLKNKPHNQEDDSDMWYDDFGNRRLPTDFLDKKIVKILSVSLPLITVEYKSSGGFIADATVNINDICFCGISASSRRTLSRIMKKRMCEDGE